MNSAYNSVKRIILFHSTPTLCVWEKNCLQKGITSIKSMNCKAGFVFVVYHWMWEHRFTVYSLFCRHKVLDNQQQIIGDCSTLLRIISVCKTKLTSIFTKCQRQLFDFFKLLKPHNFLMGNNSIIVQDSINISGQIISNPLANWCFSNF